MRVVQDQRPPKAVISQRRQHGEVRHIRPQFQPLQAGDFLSSASVRVA